MANRIGVKCFGYKYRMEFSDQICEVCGEETGHSYLTIGEVDGKIGQVTRSMCYKHCPRCNIGEHQDK